MASDAPPSAACHHQHHHRRLSSSTPHVHHGYNVVDDEAECASHKGLEVWKGETEAEGSSLWGAVFNIVTSLVGVGIVGLPYAMAQAGWIGGMAMLLVATFLAMYCGNLLAVCMNKGIPGHQFQTFTELGEYCGGRLGRYLGFYASYGGCLGGCIFFVITAVEQLQILFPHTDLPWSLWALLFGACSLPACLLKTLGHVGGIALLGALTSAIIMLLVVVMTVSEKVQGHTEDLPKEHRLVGTSAMDLSYAFVKIIFSYGGMCVFPEINRCMRKPSDFGKAIWIACGSTMFFYVLLMCTTYDAYGSYLLSDPSYANVVRLLPNNWAAKVIAISMLAHVYAAYVVNMNPIFRGIEELAGTDDRPGEFWWRFGNRTLWIGTTVVAAIAMPFFGDVLSLIGASQDSLSGCILPTWFFLVLFWKRPPVENLADSPDESTPLTDPNHLSCTPEELEEHNRERPGSLQVAQCFIILIFMCTVAGLGTYQALENILSNYF